MLDPSTINHASHNLDRSWMLLNATLPSLTSSTCTGTRTLRASSPGRFIGAENPATHETGALHVGQNHLFCADGSADATGFFRVEGSISRTQTLQN
jgi:hypothetical protein